MADLFQTSIPNVSMHIRNIFREGELKEESVVKDFLTTAADGKRYRTNYFNLDEFLRISERDILTHAGGVSHEEAAEKARAEYEKYHVLHAGVPSPVEQHFVKAVNEVKALEKIKKPRKKKRTEAQ
jgi:hypothetical protein